MCAHGANLSEEPSSHRSLMSFSIHSKKLSNHKIPNVLNFLERKIAVVLSDPVFESVFVSPQNVKKIVDFRVGQFILG